MDRDVIECVLDRPIGDDELVPGRLPGYRRVRTAHAPYPKLVPDPAGEVGGIVLRRPTRRDEVRIRHFEDDEYVDRWLIVRLADGRRLEARVFFAADHLGHTEEPWDLDRWAREHKARYLEECRAWMRECPG